MSKRPPARVGVAISSLAAGRAALEAAVQLAAALDAELTALFMENADLTRAAALPGLSETGAVSGVARPMEAGQMRRALRAHADQARTAVAEAAQSTGVLWSFEVVRSSGIAAICDLQQAIDLLVLGDLGLPHAASLYAPWPVFPAAAPHRGARHPVALVLEDANSAAPALRVAQLLASEFKTPLLVVVCTADEALAEGLRRVAKSALKDVTAPVRYAVVRECTPPALAAMARAHRAQLLIFSDGRLRQNKRRLEELLARLQCPLVIAG